MNSLLPTTFESSEKTDNHDIFKINQVLENEHLVRKEVSQEHDSLFRAFSDGLYFTPIYYHQIKDQLIRYLSNLITTNTIPSKLGIFRGNSVLWNDYSKNPSCPDFMKINIELFSLVFSVRVVVYTVTADGNLTAKIFNNKFDRTIQFINTNGAHLDVIHSKKSIQIITACQDVILNLVEMALEGKQDFKQYEWKDFSSENYTNSWLSSASSSQEVSKVGESTETSKTQYKRAKSDSDLKALQVPNSNLLQSYNMFVDSKPTEEISKIIQRDVSGLSQSINLNLINESGARLGENSSISEGKTNLNLAYRKSFPNQKRTVQSDEDEDLLPPEPTSLSKSKSYMDSNQITRHFNVTPPGLTPNRYSTKTYGNDNFTQATSTTETQPIIRHRMSENFGQSHSLLHDLPHHGFNNQNKAKTTPRNIGGSTTTEDVTRAQGNGNATPGNEAGHQISRAANPRTSEKKKPVIIDESQHRHTGKLKFFDEGKSYGFIVMDEDGSDIFVHLDDLLKANISKDALKAARFGNSIRLSFNSMEYIGKYNKSRKATDIQLLA